MALLTLTNAHLAYGHVPLLDGASLSIDGGERIGLIGRNGSGKSSLLKILAGLERPDDGVLQVQQGLRRFYVAQEPEFAGALTVFDAVSEGVAEAKRLREQLVGACAGQCLGFQLALLGRLEGREVTGIGAQLAAVELDDARGHRIEKGAVVRDQEQRTAKVVEQVLQPEDGVEVEMVGRLVEQQHLGRRDQRLCQRDALLRAAAQ